MSKLLSMVSMMTLSCKLYITGHSVKQGLCGVYHVSIICVDAPPNSNQYRPLNNSEGLFNRVNL
jgi:hypothetical protein